MEPFLKILKKKLAKIIVAIILLYFVSQQNDEISQKLAVDPVATIYWN